MVRNGRVDRWNDTRRTFPRIGRWAFSYKSLWHESVVNVFANAEFKPVMGTVPHEDGKSDALLSLRDHFCRSLATRRPASRLPSVNFSACIYRSKIHGPSRPNGLA
jgi:hypothetical protein